MENLHRDRYWKDIFEDRGGTGGGDPTQGSLQRERGEESKKRKSRDLNNTSLKTDGETESREPT